MYGSLGKVLDFIGRLFVFGLKLRSFLVGLSLFLFAFGIYLHNLSPSVYGGDVGDFVTAVFVKGVPHPQGYPVFTLLGILFNYLPINQTVAWKVGLVSVVFSSFSVLLMYLISLELVKSRIIALISSLTLAFIYPFWIYAEVAEVFGLTYFFVFLLIYIALIYRKSKNKSYLYLLSLICGLSLAAHEITVLAFPSVLLLVLFADYKAVLKPLVALRCIPLFLLGFFLPYVYVPIAASQDPFINWGNAVNLKNFIHLILRLDYAYQYRTIPMNLLNASAPILTSIFYWIIQLPALVTIACVLGSVDLFMKRKFSLFYAFLLGFFLTAFIFLAIFGARQTALVPDNYSLYAYERFYIFSVIFFLLFFPFGVLFAYNSFVKITIRLSFFFRSNAYFKYLFLLPFVLIPISLFIRNYPKTDLHDIWLGDYLGEDILNSLPKGSTVFLIVDDNFEFNTVYAHQVKKVRNDVLVAANLLNNSNGYFGAGKRFLTIYSDTLKTHKKITNYDRSLLALELYGQEKPLFSNIAPSPIDKKLKKVVWIPYGLVYKVADADDKNKTKEEYLALAESIWSNYRVPKAKSTIQAQHSFVLKSILEAYSSSAIRIGNHLASRYGDMESARNFYQKAINVFPGGEAGHEAMGRYYLYQKQCVNALRSFANMININKVNENGYIFSYLTYKKCSNDSVGANLIKAEYKKVFRKDIEKNINFL